MTRTAIYSRVSSDRQERERTILSQMAELRASLEEEGIRDFLEFSDEGYSRDNLDRPSLDRMRDLIQSGAINRAVIQAPDRLASGARLVILVEEFQKAGARVDFLRGGTDDTAEGKLMLQVQGAIGEYERTKIRERTRRGRLYWARQGAYVGGTPPYGYRIAPRAQGERGRLLIDEFESQVVQDMFRYMSEDRLSTRAIAMRLTERGIPTARGAAQWQPSAVQNILRRETYRGEWVYQRTESVLPARRSPRSPLPKRKTAHRMRDESEWIRVPVPQIINAETWFKVQDQLMSNSERSPRNNKRHKYLLRGLIKCPRCDGRYSGAADRGVRRYRCTAADPTVSSTGRRCTPGSFKAEPVEVAVWDAVSDALQQPDLLKRQFQSQLQDLAGEEMTAQERAALGSGLKRLGTREDRITDAYVAEAMALDRYKSEMAKIKRQRDDLEEQLIQLDDRVADIEHSRKAMEGIDEFCALVADGLGSMEFDDRQTLLQTVVESITVDDGRVRVEGVLPIGGTDDRPDELRPRHPEAVEGWVVSPHTAAAGLPGLSAPCGNLARAHVIGSRP